VYSELAYQRLAVMKIVLFECYFQLFHGILEIHTECLFADIDDTVSRSHTSVLLKRTQNKLGRLFAFVITAASGCLFYHCCGSPHGVSRDHLQVSTSVYFRLGWIRHSRSSEILSAFGARKRLFACILQISVISRYELFYRSTYEIGNAG
jgi:hypothetical protein